jgi:hypothetical protein
MRNRTRFHVLLRLGGLSKGVDDLRKPCRPTARLIQQGVEPSALGTRGAGPHGVLTTRSEEREALGFLLGGLSGAVDEINIAAVLGKQGTEGGRVLVSQDKMGGSRASVMLDDRVVLRLNRERLAATHP